MCFFDCHKGCDRVKHNKLMEVRENRYTRFRKAIDRKLILKGKFSASCKENTYRVINISRGVRQDCIVSPVSLNL